MKNKETLEEVLKFPLIIEDGLEYLKLSRKIFEAGIRHQQEQDKKLYSDEEVIEFLNKREQYLIESVGEFYKSNLEWFEQNKKK